jgi:hypothetical protein
MTKTKPRLRVKMLRRRRMAEPQFGEVRAWFGISFPTDFGRTRQGCEQPVAMRPGQPVCVRAWYSRVTGPKGSSVRCPQPVRARVTVPQALFGDKVVTSTIVATYGIDQPSLDGWPEEPELRRGPSLTGGVALPGNAGIARSR